MEQKEWTVEDCLRHEAAERRKRDKIQFYFEAFWIIGAAITVLATTISVFFQ